MILVKICGITTLDDALAAAGAGADALGFNFWPRSPRFIQPAAATAIMERLPAGILKVGAFVDEPDPRVEGLDILQLHGASVAPPSARWWQAWPATTERLRERMEESNAEAFLIDAPAGALRGGTGQTFDWSLAADLPGKIILAGGLGPENVAAAIRQVRPWGVDACSRLETAPGRKDHELVARFIRAARQVEL